MGRTKYSPEARNAIMAAFVKATKEIIETDGVDAASIRRVSTSAGYSSATLYLYFEDMTELITMSLISHLSEYTGDIIQSTPEKESPEGAYLRSWELFCMHAFSEPSIYLNLFFGSRSKDLDVIAKKYYELFPEELERASGSVLEMLELGNLHSRNFVVLQTFAKDLGLSERDTRIANDLTVAYFHSFLIDIVNKELTRDEMRDLVDEFMEGALFVLRLD